MTNKDISVPRDETDEQVVREAFAICERHFGMRRPSAEAALERILAELHALRAELQRLKAAT